MEAQRRGPAVLEVTWRQDLMSLEADISAQGAQGRIAFQGSGLAHPGASISLAGVGARLSGDVFVTAVEHEIADGDWITRAEFGPAPRA